MKLDDLTYEVSPLQAFSEFDTLFLRWWQTPAQWD